MRVSRGGTRSRAALCASALVLALLVAGLLIGSCRDRPQTNARADDEPGATSGTLLIICTGDTRAALETCS